MKRRLAIMAIMLLVLTNTALAQNESESELLCEWPDNYVTANDITALRQDIANARDDSASIRRMSEVNARKLDDLMTREWATTGEVENLSDFMNSSIASVKQEFKTDMELYFGQMAFRLQTIKAQMFVIMVASLLFSLVLTNIIHGWRYKELQKQYGVQIKRTPMTPREKELAEKVKKLTKEKEVYDDPPKQRNKYLIAGSVLVVAVVTAVIVMFIAWFIGVV